MGGSYSRVYSKRIIKEDRSTSENGKVWGCMDRSGYGKVYLKSPKGLFVAISNIIFLVHFCFVFLVFWNLIQLGKIYI